jgi:hypothetical protein
MAQRYARLIQSVVAAVACASTDNASAQMGGHALIALYMFLTFNMGLAATQA